MSTEKLKLGFPEHYEIREVNVPDGEPRPWDADTKHTHVGSRHTRLDGVAKVTGRAKYPSDTRLPGMLYGALVMCPHPHARVASIDASEAEKMPGVKAVVAYPDRHVRFAGKEVAAVAATTQAQADAAAGKVKVEYEVLPFVVDLEAARKPGAPQVFDNREGNLGRAANEERGDLAAGFEKAGTTLEQTYTTEVQTHSSLETHGCVAHWEAPERLTLYYSTQGIFGMRDAFARHYNGEEGRPALKAENVKVVTDYMGGGFGSKLQAYTCEQAAAELARKANAPVHLFVNRKYEHLGTGNRPSSIQRVKAGCTKDGKLTAWDAEIHGTAGIGGGAGAANPAIYDIPATRKVSHDVYTNAGPGAPFRAPGWPQGIFAVESMMDELAHAIGMDPLEFRHKNNPNPVRAAEFDLGAEKIGWSRRNKVPGAGAGPRKRGVGMATGRWGNVGGGRLQAQCDIHPDGGVEIFSGCQDLGTGTRTIIGLITAEEIGLPVEAVSVKIGSTAYPLGPTSGGSSTAPGVSPVVRKAAWQAKNRLFELVAAELEVGADLLESRGGKVFVSANESKSMSWKQACGLIKNGKISELATRGDNFDGFDRDVAGAQFAEVEVDVETGRIKVIKVVAVHDCGTVLDELTAESQVIGAVIQGMSYALLENRILDNNTGAMVNPNLEQYKISGSWDMPEIVPIMYSVANGFNNTGVQGVGEPPTVPTAAALANAVFNATGARVRSLPMTPWTVMAALEAAKGGRP